MEIYITICKSHVMTLKIWTRLSFGFSLFIKGDFVLRKGLLWLLFVCRMGHITCSQNGLGKPLGPQIPMFKTIFQSCFERLVLPILQYQPQVDSPMNTMVSQFGQRFCLSIVILIQYHWKGKYCKSCLMLNNNMRMNFDQTSIDNKYI